MKEVKITIGKNAGFCYGVSRAVEGAHEALKENKTLYCLGEIVHNKEVIKELEDMGLITVQDINEIQNKTLIRAHGIAKEIYQYLEDHNISIIDFTCPKVLHIHKIASDYEKLGYYIILLGSKKHPENIGTISYCSANSSILENIDEVKEKISELNKSNIKKLLVISQTTFSIKAFKEIKEYILANLNKDIELVIKNTICNATDVRQQETKSLSTNVELMIIIGGKNSSNTRKLYDIAKENTATIWIENESELDLEILKNLKTIGIMAGASTPMKSIDDVVEKIKTKKIYFKK